MSLASTSCPATARHVERCDRAGRWRPDAEAESVDAGSSARTAVDRRLDRGRRPRSAMGVPLNLTRMIKHEHGSPFVVSVDASSPAPFTVAAHPAAPVLRIIVGARQQFAGAGCLDHGDGAVRPGLRALGVERHSRCRRARCWRWWR